MHMFVHLHLFLPKRGGKLNVATQVGRPRLWWQSWPPLCRQECVRQGSGEEDACRRETALGALACRLGGRSL